MVAIRAVAWSVAEVGHPPAQPSDVHGNLSEDGAPTLAEGQSEDHRPILTLVSLF